MEARSAITLCALIADGLTRIIRKVTSNVVRYYLHPTHFTDDRDYDCTKGLQCR